MIRSGVARYAPQPTLRWRLTTSADNEHRVTGAHAAKNRGSMMQTQLSAASLMIAVPDFLHTPLMMKDTYLNDDVDGLVHKRQDVRPV